MLFVCPVLYWWIVKITCFHFILFTEMFWVFFWRGFYFIFFSNLKIMVCCLNFKKFQIIKLFNLQSEEDNSKSFSTEVDLTFLQSLFWFLFSVFFYDFNSKIAETINLAVNLRKHPLSKNLKVNELLKILCVKVLELYVSVFVYEFCFFKNFFFQVVQIVPKWK